MKSSNQWDCWGGIFDWDKSQKKLVQLNEKAEDPELWNNPEEAQKLMRERQHLEKSIATILAIQSEMDDSVELIALGEEEGDDGVIAEA